MKTKFLFYFSLLFFLFQCSYLFSAKKKISKKQKTIKIGYIDVENIVDNSNLKNKVQKNYLEYKNKIKKIKIKTENKILETKKEISQKSFLLGYQEYQKEIQKLQSILSEYEAEIIQLKNNLQIWEKQSTKKLLDELILAIEIIARNENVDIIISQEPIVIYGKSYLDYTEKVKSFLNEINQRNNPTAR